MNTIVNGKNVAHLMIGNREVGSGDAVWLDGTGDSFTDDNIYFIEEVAAQPAARKFDERFPLGPNFDLIMATARKLHPDAPFITTSRFIDALKTLAAGSSDKLIAKPAAAPTAPAAPVDKNGRVLGASQKAWQEHAEWSRTASSRDIAERRRVDPSFAKFYASSLQIEMTHEIDGDVRPLNPHLTPQKELSNDALRGAAAKASLLLPQLMEWVKIYNQTPASKVRLLRSPGANPTGAEAYNQAFDAACAANLI